MRRPDSEGATVKPDVGNPGNAQSACAFTGKPAGHTRMPPGLGNPRPAASLGVSTPRPCFLKGGVNIGDDLQRIKRKPSCVRVCCSPTCIGAGEIALTSVFWRDGAGGTKNLEVFAEDTGVGRKFLQKRKMKGAERHFLHRWTGFSHFYKLFRRKTSNIAQLSGVATLRFSTIGFAPDLTSTSGNG